MSEERDERTAAAEEILLTQLQLLQEQSKRIVASCSAVPADNLAAISHEMADIGRVLLETGRAEE